MIGRHPLFFVPNIHTAQEKGRGRGVGLDLGEGGLEEEQADMASASFPPPTAADGDDDEKEEGGGNKVTSVLGRKAWQLAQKSLILQVCMYKCMYTYRIEVVLYLASSRRLI